LKSWTETKIDETFKILQVIPTDIIMADESTADDAIIRNQKELEKKWQDKWEETKIYKFDPNSEKPVYSIDVPPRYASGALHVGHAVHYTHIDFVARYKRMCGHNVFFPLCFDVNGIPIEERVERKLGITRKNIDRHEFIKLCREFADQNIGEMTRQFKILGESMDPSIYYQTDADYYRRLTQISFIKLYKKGMIYKGKHPINWCPRCITALADAEVEYKDRDTMLNYIKFKLGDTNEDIIIATTRPELLPACQAVLIHPDDKRAEKFVGKRMRTPIFNKEVPIYKDEAVDPNFGTGIVMVCTIGDKEDLEWIFKYNLPIENAITDEGKMAGIAGNYAGKPIAEARAAIIADMKKEKLLVKQEKTVQSVGTCWRCSTPVEFLDTPQWFLKLMDYRNDILKTADEIKWNPEYMKIRLVEWVNSLKWDWVISRQRYFATPIPVWECVTCGEAVVAKEESCYMDPTIEHPPVKSCPKCGGKLKACEDVFDTWMDSSISPLYNSFWQRDEKLFKKLFPMSLRPQSHDIIRTWAFYTITRSLFLTGKKPFNDIMMGGFILAVDGKPMHTHLGNVIDPLEVLDKYGTEAFRYYASTCALGEDNAFRWKDLTRGIRLVTKFFNIEKFIGQAIKDENAELNTEKLRVVDRWILSKYSKVVKNATEAFDSYRFEKAMKEVEYFIWHELADHYLEMVKYRVRKNPDHPERITDKAAVATLRTIGLGIAKLIAPFLPHASEEVYDLYFKDADGYASIHVSQWPSPVLIDEDSEKKGGFAKDIISEIRKWKVENGLSVNTELKTVEIIAGGLRKAVEECKDDIKETMRVKQLLISESKKIEEKIVGIKPVLAAIGPKFKKDAGEIVTILKALTPEKIGSSLKNDILEIKLKRGEKIKLTKDYFQAEKKETSDGKDIEVLKVGDVKIVIEK